MNVRLGDDLQPVSEFHPEDKFWQEGVAIEAGHVASMPSGKPRSRRADAPSRRARQALRARAETGMAGKLGYNSSASLRAAYPKFFWSVVTPYIGEALSNLHMTQEGKLWVANLYSHIFAEEHKLPALGAKRLRD